MRIRLAAPIVTVALLATATTPALAAPDRPELRRAMAEVLANGAVGIQVRVHDREGDWAGAGGTTRLGGREEVRPDGRFRIGSATKTVVATVLLQLVAEGRIGLEDPAVRHLPRFALDERITVRMLLQHTSGLFSYTGEPNPDGTVDSTIAIMGRDFPANQFRHHTAEELVRGALAKPARFAPGTAYSYSNTNYVLAGLLIEQVTGTPYAEQARRRIIGPLGLRGTSLPGDRTGIPGRHAHGYYSYRDGGQVSTVDTARQNMSWAGAAGEIISTTRDLDTFLTALNGGKLLPPHLLAEMRRAKPTGPNRGYGLGLGEQGFGPGCDTVYGHVGGTHGYSTFMFGTNDNRKRIQISVTTAGADLESGSPVEDRTTAATGKLLKALACAPAA